MNTTGQWSGAFGEQLVKELFAPNIWKPEPKDGYAPDFETPEYMIEVKTGTHLTPGTAHEKIFGVAWKYRHVPSLYGKKLVIVTVGRAEVVARRSGLMDAKEFSKVFRNHRDIRVVGLGDLMRSSFALEDGSFE